MGLQDKIDYKSKSWKTKFASCDTKFWAKKGITFDKTFAPTLSGLPSTL